MAKYRFEQIAINRFKDKLGIKEGECTKDGKFSLDTTRCLGCCGLAPVMAINDEIYGNVQVKDIKKILVSNISNEWVDTELGEQGSHDIF